MPTNSRLPVHSQPVPEGASKLRGFFAVAQRNAWENGIICASLACIIFSFSSLQVKLTGGRVPVLQLCIIRSLLSFSTSVVSGRIAGIKPLFGHKQHFHLLLLRGFFGTLAIASSYVALLTLPLGDAVTLAQMRPPATAVMARFLLAEPLGVRGVVGSLISVAGVVVLAHPPFLMGGHAEWSHKRLIGTLCGVASTLFATGTGYAVRRIGKKEPALTVALWFHTITICLMTWPLLAGIPEAPKPVAWKDCLLLLGIATASFSAQLLMTRSYQLLAAARAAAVSFMSVIYSQILGALVFHERFTASTASGGVLIFIGVILVTVRSDNNSSSSSGSSSSPSAEKTIDLSSEHSDSDTNSRSPLLSASSGQPTQDGDWLQHPRGKTEAVNRPAGLQRPAWLQNLLRGRRDAVGDSNSGNNSEISSKVAYQPVASQELAFRGHEAPAGDADVYIQMPGPAQATQLPATQPLPAGRAALSDQYLSLDYGPFAVQQQALSTTPQQGISSFDAIGSSMFGVLLRSQLHQSADGQDDRQVLLEGQSSSWSPWPSAEHPQQQQQLQMDRQQPPQ